MKKFVGTTILITSLSYLTACGTSNAIKGTGIGAVAGAAIGAAIGDKPGREKEGAIIGSVIGAGIGGFIGNRIDKQAQELNTIPGVSQVKVEKEEGNEKIDFQMKVLFDFDDASIKPSEHTKLDKFADVLSKYPENIVLIEGHTDDRGEDDYNQTLSEQRAESIKNYLNAKNPSIKLSSVGYGESKPIVPNDTEDGRALNRRVVIKITIDQQRAAELYQNSQ
ncbi:OmpA family protein [Candidatus Marithrix sp. Canyon 246]|nr:OmpA family protein [Candidatus Marithrix sp. Canyon 246]